MQGIKSSSLGRKLMPETQKGYIRYAVYLAYRKVIVAAPSNDSSKFDLVEQACSDLHQSY